MNGDITVAALCHCQRASKVKSPFINFAVIDVSFRRSAARRYQSNLERKSKQLLRPYYGVSKPP